MPGFDILGLGLIAFIAYLYLPAAAFRFGAEHFIDMRPRTDSSEVAEFIAAAIPSFAFHFVTYAALRAVSLTLTWFISFTSWLHTYARWAPVIGRQPLMPVVDWTLISSLITGQHKDYVAQVLRSRTIASAVYFFAVVAVSLSIGLMFGSSHLDRLRKRTAWEASRLEALVEWLPGLEAIFTTYPDSFARFPNPSAARRVFSRRTRINRKRAGITAGPAALVLFIPKVVAWIAIELAYGVTFAIGTLLFQEGVEPWFHWSERKPSVFVRTKDQRLYFGQFRQYSKKRSGEMDTLTIDSPWRYCYDERLETIAEGRIPFSEFGGSLEIAREEVAEIHETTREHFARIYNRYVAIHILYLRQTLLETFAGERLTLDEMWIRQGGGDHFIKDDFYLALQELVGAEVIGEFEGTAGASVYTFPSRRGHGPQPSPSHSMPVEPQPSVIGVQEQPDSPTPPRKPPGSGAKT
ncbi:MAG: hypothetical protein QOE82_3754 [Thermoanaerobaculia bacterium]|jgi:hypothetical protein|nr:hypothetical protein [Thermoanaerobaculia bacterium]